MDSNLNRLARLLNCDHDYLASIDKRLSAVSGRTDVLDSLVGKLSSRLSALHSALKLSESAGAKEIYHALLRRVESDNRRLSDLLHVSSLNSPEENKHLADLALHLSNPPAGFFLKIEKARALLLKNPPLRVLAYLNYPDVDSALQKEDIFELFSALRFLEDREWLNKVFFREYSTLTPDDFEERPIRLLPLSEKWRNASAEFVAKKWHNLSHLKELGVLFILPFSANAPGELLRAFSLLLHYLEEIPFYSNIFRNLASDPSSFAENLTSLLRGDVIDELPAPSKVEGPASPVDSSSLWLVVQRYLAKEDEYDWRLFYPHLNTESLLWRRAESKLSSSPEISDLLSIWRDSAWIGEYLPDDAGLLVPASFNMVDAAMSLVKEKEGNKYTYHQHEALWNKLYTSYFSDEAMERAASSHLLRGWFAV